MGELSISAGDKIDSTFCMIMLVREERVSITCTMSRPGNVWDNSAMESFFSSLKTERTARNVYRTRDAVRSDVFDYIERFDNSRRRHSKPGYISPMEFEPRAMLP